MRGSYDSMIILSYIISKILCEPNKFLLDLYLRSMRGSYDSRLILCEPNKILPVLSYERFL